MKKVSPEDNFHFLFIALMALLFTNALLQQLNVAGQKAILALLIACLAISIVGVRRREVFYRIWYACLLLLAAVSGAVSFLENLDLSVLTLATLLFFLLSHTYAAGMQIILAGKVTRNQLVGSICVYLLIGLSWAFIYLLLLELSPHSFHGIEHQHWIDNMFNAIYFSFITLTTVGYGDISPALPMPKFFVFIESILGSFYLAIMVASLVSSWLNQAAVRKNSRKE